MYRSEVRIRVKNFSDLLHKRKLWMTCLTRHPYEMWISLPGNLREFRTCSSAARCGRWNVDRRVFSHSSFLKKMLRCLNSCCLDVNDFFLVFAMNWLNVIILKSRGFFLRNRRSAHSRLALRSLNYRPMFLWSFWLYSDRYYTYC